jgi:hypothetical protein
MSTVKNNLNVSHLQLRELQAPLVAALIMGFIEEMGYERAVHIARAVIEKDAINSGKQLAEKYSGNTIADLAKIVRQVWAADGTMEIKIISENDDELVFDVKRCGYAELYEKLGIKDLGCILSCDRDFAFMQGFNPQIKLMRTKTIMEGAECCDFRYLKGAEK